MAEFCLQCSKDVGAPPNWSDFLGMEKEGLVLCEGCGRILVGSKGECLGCAKHELAVADGEGPRD